MVEHIPLGSISLFGLELSDNLVGIIRLARWDNCGEYHLIVLLDVGFHDLPHGLETRPETPRLHDISLTLDRL